MEHLSKCTANGRVRLSPPELCPSVSLVNTEPRLQPHIDAAYLTDLLIQAPIAMCLFHGPEHICTLVNPAFRTISRVQNLIGKSAREVWPYLEGQGFFEFLDDVYRTGTAITITDVPVYRIDPVTQQQEARRVHLTYQPLHISYTRNTATGILHLAVDVTAQFQDFHNFAVHMCRFCTRHPHSPETRTEESL